ncbi:glycosyltransferase family 2 protein [Bombilactobacillus thymidiniphilus]|uniref:Glycosyltransferase family 2 protein n=1 Tax=Bombilactobacillus thymidiniphilus TaxID=2923363 RepID=A0ABY4PDS5_9LACO|nr:glycosyltransferase family 2 protein [Bombilactobacillus thymidiniphilus]UQS83427.1 glycosyltransferase family 2 protein [Bombilactobacillus thymidiniphilus]
MTKKISIIVPCYNEEKTVDIFYKAICETFKKIPNYQPTIIFVNDGSIDQTLPKLRKLVQQPEIESHYLSFSRQFGKEAGIYAGLKNATGELVTIMDADLQDPPEMLIEMVHLLETTDYDCIGTARENRKGEPPIRSFFSNMFYKLINKISDTQIVPGARDFRLMRRNMVDAILELTEYNRFSKGIFSWVGFKTKYLPYKNVERVAGTSSWNFWGLFKYSIEGITDFSTVPLIVAVWLGLLVMVIAFLALMYIVLSALISGNPTRGWSSTISIILFLGGMQLFFLGIIGNYIGKIFLEVKQRPLYIIKEKK